MRMDELSEDEMRRREIEDVRERAYSTICPRSMNRAERRTAYGRMLVAQAEVAAMRAELEYLRGLHGVNDEGQEARG